MLWHPDSFVYRDSIIGAVSRRAGALFFAPNQTAGPLGVMPNCNITEDTTIIIEPLAFAFV